MKLFLLSLIVVITFIGCGSYVESNVSVFHNLPKYEKEKIVKYKFVPLKDQLNNLEFDTYKNKIKKKLLSYNFIEDDTASLAIGFIYGIDRGREKVTSTPIFGQTGVSSSYTTGNLNSYGTYSGMTTYTPTYGVVSTSTNSHTEYERYLILHIYDNNLNKNIYEAKVISKGTSQSITAVIDEMIDSLFSDFPGESGKTKTINQPFIE